MPERDPPPSPAAETPPPAGKGKPTAGRPTPPARESLGPSLSTPGTAAQRPVGEAASRAQPTPETSALAELIEGPVKGPVRIIFLDADGTLTDGVIGHAPDHDFRHFWVRDGIALQWARDLAVLSVVISGRRSKAVVARMEDLNLEYYEGVRDKVAVAQKVLDREGVKWEQCVMVGDDLPDVALMKKVAWPIAVANAQPEVKLIAKTVLGTYGGQGAVREMVEMVLRHNGTWDQVLGWYEAR